MIRSYFWCRVVQYLILHQELDFFSRYAAFDLHVFFFSVQDINQYSLRKRALDELGFMGSGEVCNALYGQPLAAWLPDSCVENLSFDQGF